MERNNQNNPTGKPFCCKIGCNKDADWQLWLLAGDTQSCNDHIGELAGDVKEFHAVQLSPITQSNIEREANNAS